MKKQLFVLFLVSLTTALFAQNPPDTLWTKTYGGIEDEIARCVQQTNDGGYIITGNIGPYNSSEILLIKTDQDGNTTWEQSFGDQYHDAAYSVIQTLDEGYIIAGSTFLDSPNFYDAWIIKTDLDGNVIWDNTYGGEDSEVAKSIIQLEDGKFVIAGSTTSYGSGCFDAWLFKIDQMGNLEWQHTYGGEANENAMSLQQTLDEGFIIAGGTELPGSGVDAWIIKTDQDGNVIWDYILNISDFDLACSILQTEDEGYIIAGLTETDSTSYADALLIKVDQGGDLEWYNTYGGSEDEMVFSVLQTDDSDYIVAGFTESFGAGSDDVWIIKTDENGNLIWDITLGGSEEDLAYSIQQTNDDGFILAGYTESFGAGQKDFWLIKLSSETGNDENLISFNSKFQFSNYPNPFNPTTTISFNLTAKNAKDAKIIIYNIKGQKIKQYSIFNNQYSITWNGTDENNKPVCSGIYFYRMNIDDKTISMKKMLLLK